MNNQKIIDGFIFRVYGEKEILIIEPDRLNACIDYIIKKEIKNIEINSINGDIDNLDFLYHVPFIESITIIQKGFNIVPINILSNLKYLSVENKIEQQIDLKAFPNLEFIAFIDTPKITNLDSCVNLRGLNIHQYRHENLYQLRHMSKLDNIFLYRPLIKNLVGIENLKHLNFIDLQNAAKLESLNGLSTQHANLQKLYIYNAKKLTNYDNLKYTIHLEDLWIQKTQDIPTLSFLRNYKNLKRIVLGGMKILDNDFSLLKSIPESYAINSPYNTIK